MQVVFPGVLCVSAPEFTTYESSSRAIEAFCSSLPIEFAQTFPLITVCDDSSFTAATLNNWLWVTFTRSNPSHDVYGVASFIQNKHWGCRGSVVIDARRKPFHAPPVDMPADVRQKAKEILGI
jgi:4-hydroxy-3-polyprenylbenzoate decarboxylase